MPEGKAAPESIETTDRKDHFQGPPPLAEEVKSSLPPRIKEVQDIIRSHISEKQGLIAELKEQILNLDLSENYRRDLPEIVVDIEQEIRDDYMELSLPTWSAGIRPTNPDEFAYHGTQGKHMDNISRVGLIPTVQIDNPDKSLVWFAGPEEASSYGGGSNSDSSTVLLRFPSGVVGRSRITSYGGPEAVSHAIPAYLIDESQDGGKTWTPIESVATSQPL